MIMMIIIMVIIVSITLIIIIIIIVIIIIIIMIIIIILIIITTIIIVIIVLKKGNITTLNYRESSKCSFEIAVSDNNYDTGFNTETFYPVFAHFTARECVRLMDNYTHTLENGRVWAHTR